MKEGKCCKGEVNNPNCSDKRPDPPSGSKPYVQPIRVWKLGDIENKIFPTDAAADKLEEILNRINDDVVNIVWGPDLQVLELGLPRTAELPDVKQIEMGTYVVEEVNEDGDTITITAKKR